MVVHSEVSPDEEGDVASCLIGQVAVDLPEVGSIGAGALERTIDIPRSAVIGSEDEPPVSVDAIEVLEEATGCFSALDRVHTLIHEAIDGESIDLTRGEHELPETGSTRWRDSLGIKSRLDDDQIA